LEILRGGEAIDLLLTDQAMPNMTGAELVEEVRRERPNLPVVVATGYSELPAGFDESVAKLAKPFTLADLRRVLDDARIAENKH
jgi:CheY-like chemotaxis protein